ncbi:hypothetical protein [Streptomyces huasconensis]|uniref:hypothetical protein n=1 Tax=Streptomyces huasconensis TaxID=1854574 RepID=UPI0036FFB0A5
MIVPPRHVGGDEQQETHGVGVSPDYPHHHEVWLNDGAIKQTVDLNWVTWWGGWNMARTHWVSLGTQPEPEYQVKITAKLRDGSWGDWPAPLDASATEHTRSYAYTAHHVGETWTHQWFVTKDGWNLENGLTFENLDPVPFMIAGQAAVEHEPARRALDHSPARKDREAAGARTVVGPPGH